MVSCLPLYVVVFVVKDMRIVPDRESHCSCGINRRSQSGGHVLRHGAPHTIKPLSLSGGESEAYQAVRTHCSRVNASCSSEIGSMSATKPNRPPRISRAASMK